MLIHHPRSFNKNHIRFEVKMTISVVVATTNVPQQGIVTKLGEKYFKT